MFLKYTMNSHGFSLEMKISIMEWDFTFSQANLCVHEWFKYMDGNKFSCTDI